MPTYLGSSVVEVTTEYDNVVTISSPQNGMTTTSDTITVTGIAIPGSTVTINGQPVTVDAQGNFSVLVILMSGNNDIIVVATDLNGNTQTVTNTVTYSTGIITSDISSWLPIAGVAGAGLLALLLLSMGRRKR